MFYCQLLFKLWRATNGPASLELTGLGDVLKKIQDLL